MICCKTVFDLLHMCQCVCVFSSHLVNVNICTCSIERTLITSFCSTVQFYSFRFYGMLKSQTCNDAIQCLIKKLVVEMTNVPKLLSHIKQDTECHVSIKTPGGQASFPSSKVKASTAHVWLIHVGIIPRNMCIIIIIKTVCEKPTSTSHIRRRMVKTSHLRVDTWCRQVMWSSYTL